MFNITDSRLLDILSPRIRRTALEIDLIDQEHFIRNRVNIVGRGRELVDTGIDKEEMGNVLDWNSSRDMWIRILEEQTGKGLDHWNERVRKEGFKDEKSLRIWLNEQGVRGYAESLLVMEQFGYPDFMTASADELVDNQYADRPNLRPIYEAIIAAVLEFGEVVIQTRMTYVSLRTPRRTFTRVQATTKTRVDIGLRLDRQKPGGRLRPSRIHETMKLQISPTSVDELDAEALSLLRQAYEENC